MELKRLFCTVCGSNNLIEIGNIYKCKACDSQFEKQHDISEDKIKLITALDDAESFIRMSPPRFDFAEEKYKIIANDYPENADAYWGLFRSKNDIKYIEGKPICFNYVDKDVRNDEAFINAKKYADKNQKTKYEEEVKKIELNIQEWKNRASEIDYDVFLSFKQTDFDGKETPDTELLLELYTFLLENNIKAFYSPYSMKQHIGEPAYDAYIYNALSKAKVLFVYGSKPEYFETDWVKCEWTRYLDMISKDKKKSDSLLVSYTGFDANCLPRELRNRQAYKSSSRTMFTDVLRKIEEILYDKVYKKNSITRIEKPKLTKYEKVEFADKILKKEIGLNSAIKDDVELVLTPVETRKIGKIYEKENSKTVEDRLSRIQSFIEYNEYELAKKDFEIVNSLDKNNPKTVLYGILIDNKCKDIESLLTNENILFNNNIFEKIKYIIEYSNAEEAETYFSKINDVIIHLIEKNEFERSFFIYKQVIDYDSKTIEKLRKNLLDLLKISCINQSYNNSIISFIDLSAEYLSKKEIVYFLKKYIEEAIQVQNYELSKYFYDKLLSIENYTFEIVKYDLSINYKLSNPTYKSIIEHIAINNSFADFDEALIKTDKKSAQMIIDEEKKILIEYLNNENYQFVYNISKDLIQYDFYDKNDYFSYIFKYICLNPSNHSDSVYDLLFSAFLSEVINYNDKISCTFKEDDYEYESKDNNKYYYLKKYIGKNTKIVVNEKVVEISEGAFFDNRDLEEIVIDSNVKKINYSFKNCINLKSVTINNDDIILSKNAFEGCLIEKLACATTVLDCFDLSKTKDLFINGGKILDDNKIINCKKLEKINFSETIEEIKPGSLDYIPRKLLKREKNICYLGSGDNPYYVAFSCVANQYSYYINRNCRFIYFSFECQVSRVNFEGTIEDWKKIKLVSYYSNPIYCCSFYLKKDEDDYYKMELNELEIPEGTDALEPDLYYDLTHITDIVLPRTIIKIDLWRNEIKYLNNLYFNGTIEDWCNIVFNRLGDNLMNSRTNFYILDKNGDVEYKNKRYSLLKEIVIPAKVKKINEFQFSNFKCVNKVVLSQKTTTICNYAFMNSNISEITFGNNIMKIGDYAFSNCEYLTHIDLPSNLIEIASSTFEDCIRLSDVIIGPKVEFIGENAFKNCNIREIKIPSSVKEISKGAFCLNRNLTTVNFESKVNKIGYNAFYRSKTKGDLKIT